MRRPATAALAVLTTVITVIGVTATPALAHAKPARHAKVAHAVVHHHKATPRKVRPLVTMTGVVSDTPTATIGTTSDTSTLTIAVKGGAREVHRATVVLMLDKNTVVRRGAGRATAADIRAGDHVSVRARRLAGGGWLALRVNASAYRADG